MTRIAIVVPSADPGQPRVRAALDAARATTAHLDATLRVVQDSGPGFRFSRSVNRGMGMDPDADAWVLLNDDCTMDAGWLDAMLEAARRHPEVGLVGGVLRFPRGRLQHAGARIALSRLQFLAYEAGNGAARRPWERLRSTRGRPAALTVHAQNLRRRRRIDYLTGACLLVTAECRRRVGPWEEAYEFGYEDADYSLRALEAGLELALATGATGLHPEGSSRASQAVAEKAARSEREFLRRWTPERIAKATRGRRGLYVDASAHSAADPAAVPRRP